MEGSPNSMVCWECHATLFKMQQFLDRIRKAYNIIKIGEQLLHGSLSNLTMVAINDTNKKIYVIEQANVKPDKRESLTHYDDNDDSNDKSSAIANKNEPMKIENDLKSFNKSELKTNNWARKRAMINKKPKFRTVMDQSMDALFTNMTDSEEFECKQCCSDFRGIENHKVKTYICDICNKLFIHKRHLVSHIENHGMFVCKLCELPLVEEDRFKHLHNKHRKALQCVECGLFFEKRREFFKHYKHWHESFICDYCGVSFKMKYCIKRHIRKQHSSFDCESCGKSFSWYNSLWLHKKMHHAPRLPAFCVECDTHYPDVYRYRWHLANSVKHRPPRKTRHPCSQCDKVFSKKIYMSDHYNLVHLKHYKYRCEECNKNYIRNAELLKHNRRVHEGVLPPKDKICPTCGRGFTTNKILSNHVRTHTGERPYPCTRCPARFTQSAALVTHTRSLHP